jgi:uncharacterized protein (TIGR02145 family)
MFKRLTFAALGLLFFASCAKEFRNPYDPATPPDVWMPKAFKLDTLGTNALRLSWNQEEQHIDGFAIQKTTNGQIKEILLPLDSLRYTDIQAVDTSSDEVCPELSYKVMARAGNNRSLDIGTTSVIRMPLSTPAIAGTDVIITDTTTTIQLNAQAPNAGERGQWSVISGSGGAFSNLNAHNSNFTGLPCTDYVLRWTKTGCTETFDEVNVKFQKAITAANAGVNQTFTDVTTQTTLNANTAGVAESGIWTIISGIGGTLENSSSPNTLFTGQSCSNYVLRWTIVDVCNSSSDELNINFQKATTTANAGADQTITNNATQVTLAANAPMIGETGVWTVVSGTGGFFSNTNSPTSTFIGNACSSYTLRWSIQGQCSSNFDDVVISFSQSNTIANAGPDQTITSNATQVTLAANAPAVGETGTWTILSGVGGSFSNVNSPTSTFTGNTCNGYTLRWTIGSCSANYNDVVITFQQAVSQANAGVDQNFSNATTQTTLAGNAVLLGESGQWTVVSGIGGQFANANSPTSQFTGQGCQSYTLKWTKTSCSAITSDNVVVTFNQAVTTANAGADQTSSNNSAQVTLAANAPAAGETGTWSIVSGIGGGFVNANSHISYFVGNLGQQYILKWTILRCFNSSSDQVTVSFPSITPGSGVIDIDGNTYSTQIIGYQEWMNKNLKTTRYCNGDPIPNITNNAQWSGLTSGAWSYYNNSNSNNSIYGKLYNWYAAADSRNLCPCGWHVPTDAEWTILTNYLGFESIAGGKMKALGTLDAGNGYWISPNTGATNESNFTALPGGYRYPDGTFNDINYDCTWWSSTLFNSSSSWFRTLRNNHIYVTRSNYNYKSGFFIRCLKD